VIALRQSRWYLLLLYYTIPCKLSLSYLYTTRRLDLQMPAAALDLHLLILLIFIARFFRNKHILLPIILIILVLIPNPTIYHLDLPRRQLSAIRLHRLELRILHIEHVLAQMLHALHDRLALNFLAHSGTRRFAVHFVGYERELVGPLEEDVEGGFELEDGFEDRATTEDV
jgi:hypothetical protein